MESVAFLKSKIGRQQVIDLKLKDFHENTFNLKRSCYRFQYEKKNWSVNLEKSKMAPQSQGNFNRFFKIESVEQLKLKESIVKSQKQEADVYEERKGLPGRNMEAPPDKQPFFLKFKPRKYFKAFSSVFDLQVAR